MGISAKIYLTLALWLALCCGMFTYGFGVLRDSNNSALVSISQNKDVLLGLQAQQQSYISAKKDLENLAKKDNQPQDFFTKDVSFVKELSTLEDLGKARQVDLVVGGISGTINTLGKANTQSELYVMPFAMSVTGPLPNVLNFMESLYNLKFIVTINSINLGSVDKSNVSLSMSANFYLSK